MNALFAETNQTIVERTSDNDIADSLCDVCIFIDNRLYVALSYSDCRLSAGISRLNHIIASGSDN